jgi:hypothetical protein
MSSFGVPGLAELERALDELPKATQKNVLRRVGRAALKHFVDAWKGAAPEKTGAYKGSILIGSRLTRRQAREARAEGKSSIELYAGTADPAGIQLEFGNVDQAAQPHARSAWERTQQRVLTIVEMGLAEEIERAAARLARKAGR